MGNPSGWGFTIQLPTQWIDAWGPVGQNISTPIPGSNNTAELQALLEALDYISRHKQSHGIKSINLDTDSQLAYDFLHGLSIPKQHHYLLTQIGRLIDHLLPQIQISLMKIKGHAGQQGNESADLLAKQGTTTASNIGRHSAPSRAHTLVFRAPRTFELLSLEEQVSILQQAALQAAPRTKEEISYRKEYLSEPTKRLLDRIAWTPPEDHELLQKLRKAVKRRARKDKKQHLCNNLLQDSKGPPRNNGPPSNICVRITSRELREYESLMDKCPVRPISLKSWPSTLRKTSGTTEISPLCALLLFFRQHLSTQAHSRNRNS